MSRPYNVWGMMGWEQMMAENAPPFSLPFLLQVHSIIPRTLISPHSHKGIVICFLNPSYKSFPLVPDMSLFLLRSGVSSCLGGKRKGRSCISKSAGNICHSRKRSNIALLAADLCAGNTLTNFAHHPFALCIRFLL